MKLTVKDRSGSVVAEVQGRSVPPWPPPRSGEPTVVMGTFEEGPAFPKLGAILTRFETVYTTGDVAAAEAVHNEVDGLGLFVVDADGTVLPIYNVYFHQAGNLFTVADESGN